MAHSYRFYYVALISDIATCIFSAMALYIRVALKSQYLLVGAKPFPANENVKYECFYCALKYSIFLPVARVLYSNRMKIWPHLSKRSSICIKVMFPKDERSVIVAAELGLFAKDWNGGVFVTPIPRSRSSFSVKPSHKPFKIKEDNMSIHIQVLFHYIHIHIPTYTYIYISLM